VGCFLNDFALDFPYFLGYVFIHILAEISQKIHIKSEKSVAKNEGEGVLTFWR